MPIGVPVNIASYALLVHLLCTLTPYEPGNLVWVGNSTHIYENQLETCKIQLERQPKKTPTLKINLPKTIQKWDSDSLTKYFETLKFEDVELSNYNPHPKLTYEFSSGLIKK
jgi:thymidylate synthase